MTARSALIETPKGTPVPDDELDLIAAITAALTTGRLEFRLRVARDDQQELDSVAWCAQRAISALRIKARIAIRPNHSGHYDVRVINLEPVLPDDQLAYRRYERRLQIAREFDENLPWSAD